MKTIIALAALLGLSCFAQRSSIYNFGTLSATGATFGVNVGPLAHKHTVQVLTAGSPTTCSIQLEGTLDDVAASSPTWANLSGSQTCTSSVTFHVVDRAVSGVRINLTALAGGSSPSVAVKYVGIQ